jgi:pentapeptide MXKDX repeat protein
MRYDTMRYCNTIRYHATRCDATRCDATRCDATRCDATRRDVMRRDATRRDAMRRDATRCDATRRDAMRCDTMRYDAQAKRFCNEDVADNHLALGRFVMRTKLNMETAPVCHSCEKHFATSLFGVHLACMCVSITCTHTQAAVFPNRGSKRGARCIGSIRNIGGIYRITEQVFRWWCSASVYLCVCIPLCVCVYVCVCVCACVWGVPSPPIATHTVKGLERSVININTIHCWRHSAYSFVVLHALPYITSGRSASCCRT